LDNGGIRNDFIVALGARFDAKIKGKAKAGRSFKTGLREATHKLEGRTGTDPGKCYRC
jgi:hypothetical protein